MPNQEPWSLPDWIAAAARRALLGQTPVPLHDCSSTFNVVTNQITLKDEVERALTEAKREDLAVVETEMYAERIFGDTTAIETVVEVVPLPEPLRPLPGGVAYL